MISAILLGLLVVLAFVAGVLWVHCPPYNLGWVDTMWSHFWRARENPRGMVRTGFVQCVLGTVALFLDRFSEGLIDPGCGTEVAWRRLGEYHTDCGTGQAFALLRVQGLSYAIVEDGTL